tara:strand:+ start:822 stop:1103 length:282 start_codon:yes stop_codon:yes gene_type:complete
MKISKDRIKQIIKEELEQAEAEKPQEASPETKTAMANKFKELYTLFPKIQGLDAVEIKLLDALLMGGIKAAKEGSAKSVLAMAVKKLGVEIDE